MIQLDFWSRINKIPHQLLVFLGIRLRNPGVGKTNLFGLKCQPVRKARFNSILHSSKLMIFVFDETCQLSDFS